MSCELQLIFDKKKVKKWDLEPDAALKDFEKETWLESFCASVHFIVVYEWLINDVLALKKFAGMPSGVEVWFRFRDGREPCGVTVSKRGSVLVWPVDLALRAACAAELAENMRRREKVTVTMRIRERDSDTWGGRLHAALEEYFEWQREALAEVKKKLSDGRLQKWAAIRRQKDDGDAYALHVALVQDAARFLEKYPRRSKEDLLAWRKFTKEVWGDDDLMVVPFCPRKIHSFHSDNLSLLSESESITEPIEMANILQRAIGLLEKPRLSAAVMFSDLSDVRAFCDTESVLDLTDGRGPSKFFLTEDAQERVETYALDRGYLVEKKATPTRISLVRGRATIAREWTIDHRIKLTFLVDPDVEILESFDTRIDVFYRQNDLRIFTHGVAILIRALQRQDADAAARVRRSIKTFFENQKMIFPKINGRKRRKKKVFFSDHDKVFSFDDDAEGGVTPNECAPIAYTAEMHRQNINLQIW